MVLERLNPIEDATQNGFTILVASLAEQRLEVQLGVMRILAPVGLDCGHLAAQIGDLGAQALDLGHLGLGPRPRLHLVEYGSSMDRVEQPLWSWRVAHSGSRQRSREPVVEVHRRGYRQSFTGRPAG